MRDINHFLFCIKRGRVTAERLLQKREGEWGKAADCRKCVCVCVCVCVRDNFVGARLRLHHGYCSAGVDSRQKQLCVPSGSLEHTLLCQQSRAETHTNHADWSILGGHWLRTETHCILICILSWNDDATIRFKGIVHPKMKKKHILPLTLNDIHPSRLFWCELQNNGDVACLLSNIMELDGRRLVVINTP